MSASSGRDSEQQKTFRQNEKWQNMAGRAQSLSWSSWTACHWENSCPVSGSKRSWQKSNACWVFVFVQILRNPPRPSFSRRNDVAPKLLFPRKDISWFERSKSVARIRFVNNEEKYKSLSTGYTSPYGLSKSMFSKNKNKNFFLIKLCVVLSKDAYNATTKFRQDFFATSTFYLPTEMAHKPLEQNLQHFQSRPVEL